MAKNRIIYGLILFVLLSFISIYENQITYMAFYSALLLPVASFLSALITKQKFTVFERLGTNEVRKGETFKYFLTIKNNRFFRYASIVAVFHQDTPAIISDVTTQTFSLKPFGSSEISFQLLSKLRGEYSVGVSEILHYDLLGLFCFRQRLDKSLKLTISPRTVYLSHLPLSASLSGCESNSSKANSMDEDYSVIADLKQYIPSDGYKKIHWKMSAKKNELISKTYQMTAKNSAVLIIDNSKTPNKSQNDMYTLKREDQMIESFVSVMAHCIDKQYSVSLVFLGCDSQNTISMSDTYGYDCLYNTASNIQFDGEDQFDAFFDNIVNDDCSNFVNMFVFVRGLSHSFYESCKELAFSGRHLVIFCFGMVKTEDTDRRIIELKEYGIVCFWFSRDDLFSEYF